MRTGLVKSIVLKSIARGITAPESSIDRFNELSRLRRLIATLGINCVLDVGANRGQFAQELRGIGYRGHIVSFEPVSREFALLSRHFAGDPKWTGYPIALGSEDTRMRINVPRLTVRSSLLAPIREQPGMQSEQVDVRRLDGLFGEIVRNIERPKVFLKMDTQGYDVAVFNGAGSCAADIAGLQSELSVQPLYESMPHYLEALAVYEQAGFELYNLSVVSRTRTGALLELNCFMQRPE